MKWLHIFRYPAGATSHQPDSLRQRQFLALHFFLGVPHSEIVGMLLAIELEAGTVFTNQPEPTGQARAFGASQFDTFADLLDG
jgi:hypothetical protein